MAKAKKTDTKTQEVEQVAPTQPAKKTSAAKKTKSTKAETPVKEVEKKSTSAPTPTPEKTVESTEQKETIVLAEDFSKFLASLQKFTQEFNAIKVEFKNLEKKAMREIKQAQKQVAKRKRKASNRSPSGFVKPTLISDELATFLGKEKGTEMARTDVTREINAYIRAHSLQDPANGRKINADTSLSSLLKLGKDDELTYFNLQKYMSPHFQKQADKLKLENEKVSQSQ